jgi:PP-loop superfamily ATP-utilizing enzyme
VTVDALAMVEAGEEWVRSLGFSVFRVRHMVPEGSDRGGKASATARVQIAPAEMARLPGLASRLEVGLRAVGYAAVEIDPQGYVAS